jgi:hypothetical protein
VLRERFSDAQFEFLPGLLRLRADLAGPLAASIEDDHWASDWIDHLNGLVTQCPGFLGAADCEADGGGTSSAWTTFWATDTRAAGPWLDLQVDRDAQELGDIVRAAEALPPHGPPAEGRRGRSG